MSATTAGNGVTGLQCSGASGIARLAVANCDDITSVTEGVATDFSVTAFTYAGVDKFEEIKFKRLTGEFRQAYERADNGAIGNTVEIEAALLGLDTVQYRALQDLADQCKLIAIVKLNDGRQFVAGYDAIAGLESCGVLLSDNMTSGAAFGDANEDRVIFQFFQNELSRTLDADFDAQLS